MKLEATRKDNATLGTHGGYRFSNVTFAVTQGATSGFIIQHVRRAFDVHRLTQGKPSHVPMTAAEITTYIGDASDPAFPAITEYWEAWPLYKGDEQIEDSFNLTDFMTDQKLTYYLSGTDGSFKQTGDAIFYACANPDRVLAVDLKFTLDHTITNGLLYRSAKPDASKLPSSLSNAVARATSVTWSDSHYQSVHNYKTILVSDTP